MWLAMRASLAVGAGPGVRMVHSHYHLPISKTAADLMALEKFSSVRFRKYQKNSA